MHSKYFFPFILNSDFFPGIRARFVDTTSSIALSDRVVLGDATESGLYRFAASSLSDFDSLGDKYPKVLEVPFNSETKWHLSIHKKSHASGVLTLYMKGAPERVLKACSTILVNGGNSTPLNEKEKASFLSTYEWMSSQGHRVLAFAKLELNGNDFPEDFLFDKRTKNFPV